MHELLRYPFDSHLVMKKRRLIKRELMSIGTNFIEKKIAILGGSTTHDIKEILELFLLDNGIKPSFYESEYGQYWQDAMFDSTEFYEFKPDIIFVHTSIRNITVFPEISDSIGKVDALLNQQYEHFSVMWNNLLAICKCPIIQNNLEYPFFRLMGNKDASDFHGRVNFITRLNQKFYDYAQSHDNFFINDINYQSADYGLAKWSDPLYWYMYKYALCLDAIPMLAYSVSNIIKSIYGKNKKAFALDLDNTIWGGIVGDDGVENLEIGQETSKGQAYHEFQMYLKCLQKQGIILNIVSKNEYDNVIAGLNHPQMILKPDDFIVIKANWNPKSINLTNIANDISLLPESFVFVDDNPAEREIVRQQVMGVALPKLETVEHYINVIDRAGYFEATNILKDDLTRNTMYRENMERTQLQNSFVNYEDYLKSLDMKADIKPFETIYIARIAQLTNKSNQFNLTTKRYTLKEIEAIAASDKYITLYGKLEDCFGDNGIVATTIGAIKGETLDIILWLMSCRVLKRDMEYAMMNELVVKCQNRGIKIINGYYYPTAKNVMVKDFYYKQGFAKEFEDAEGNAKWSLNISMEYKNKNKVIIIKH